MRIGIFVNTPAQWHFWKIIAKKLVENGNEVKMLFRNYLETLEVIETVERYIYSSNASSKYGKLLYLPVDIVKACRYLRKSKPDVVVGFGIYDTSASFLLRKKNIVFNDSEPTGNQYLKIQYKLFTPFIDAIITPDSFLVDLGK
ncbi:MAG: hypothetical protein QXT98_07550, partial [Archaeoglobaceae archaeon]